MSWEDFIKKKESQYIPPMTGTDLYDEITKVSSKLKAKELRKKQRREKRATITDFDFQKIYIL